MGELLLGSIGGELRADEKIWFKLVLRSSDFCNKLMAVSQRCGKLKIFPQSCLLHLCIQFFGHLLGLALQKIHEVVYGLLVLISCYFINTSSWAEAEMIVETGFLLWFTGTTSLSTPRKNITSKV